MNAIAISFIMILSVIWVYVLHPQSDLPHIGADIQRFCCLFSF